MQGKKKGFKQFVQEKEKNQNFNEQLFIASNKVSITPRSNVKSKSVTPKAIPTEEHQETTNEFVSQQTNTTKENEKRDLLLDYLLHRKDFPISTEDAREVDILIKTITKILRKKVSKVQNTKTVNFDTKENLHVEESHNSFDQTQQIDDDFIQSPRQSEKSKSLPINSTRSSTRNPNMVKVPKENNSASFVRQSRGSTTTLFNNSDNSENRQEWYRKLYHTAQPVFEEDDKVVQSSHEGRLYKSPPSKFMMDHDYNQKFDIKKDELSEVNINDLKNPKHSLKQSVLKPQHLSLTKPIRYYADELSSNIRDNDNFNTQLSVSDTINEKLSPEQKQKIIVDSYDGFLSDLRKKEKDILARKKLQEYDSNREAIPGWYEFKDQNFSDELARYNRLHPM